MIMMARTIFFSILWVIFSLSLMAQDNKPCFCDNENKDAFESNLSGEIYYAQPGLLGNEFFNGNYLNGDVVLTTGDTIANKALRYNGRIDGLLFLPSNSSHEILLDHAFVKAFSLKIQPDHPAAIFRKIKINKEMSSDSTDVFGQLLFQDKLSLYAFRRSIHTEDVIMNVGDMRVSKERYDFSPIYYFQLSNHRTIGFKKFRKRELYKLFPANKELMKRLFKEKHQRRFRNEDDLVRIAGILNEVVE
jgi:hypothetical protein